MERIPFGHRPRLWVLVGFVAGAACGRAEQTPRDPSTESARAAADLRTLCARVRDGSASSWGQPLLATPSLAELTTRVDQGDESAWCELGRMMQTYAVAECAESMPGLLEACESPAEAVEPES